MELESLQNQMDELVNVYENVKRLEDDLEKQFIKYASQSESNRELGRRALLNRGLLYSKENVYYPINAGLVCNRFFIFDPSTVKEN